MRRVGVSVAAILWLTACGRIGFDPIAATDDAGVDGAAPLCVPGADCTDLCYSGVDVCAPELVCMPKSALPMGTTCAIGSCDANAVCDGVSGQMLFPTDAVAGDETGLSLALDGNRVAITARGHDVGNLGNAGSVIIMEKQADGSWMQITRVVANTPVAGDQFGSSVALQGDRMLVGARYRGRGAGAVYAFELQADTWVQTDLIEINGSFELGAAVTIDGDRALLGSEYEDSGVGYGAAHIVERNSDGTWTPVAQLTSPLADRLGHAVSLEGDRAVVGSLWDSDIDGNENGGVHVFERASDGTWPEVAALEPIEPTQSDAIGSSVSLDGDRIAAGDQLYSTLDGDFGVGGVLIYERDDAGTWAPVTKLFDPVLRAQAGLGRSVSLKGDQIIASSVDWDTEEGLLTVFRRAPDNTWRVAARFNTPVVGGLTGVGIGGHVVDMQLVMDGNTVMVGYPVIDNPNDVRTGGVVIYDLSPL